MKNETKTEPKNGIALQRKCIDKENKMIDAITEFHEACKEFGLDKDDIETKLLEAIDVASCGQIELFR